MSGHRVSVFTLQKHVYMTSMTRVVFEPKPPVLKRKETTVIGHDIILNVKKNKNADLCYRNFCRNQ